VNYQILIDKEQKELRINTDQLFLMAGQKKKREEQVEQEEQVHEQEVT
jgi:hypothetical protein